MPRGEIRPAAAKAGALVFRINQRGDLVRVSLAGILDRDGCQELMRQVSLALPARSCQLVFDGRRLLHMDYRCVSPLIRWSRGLRSFGHCLRLVGWSAYLDAILAMEDWDRELERGTWLPQGWKVVAGTQPVQSA